MRYGFNLIVVKEFINKFIDRHYHSIYMCVMFISLITIYSIQRDYYQPFVEDNRRLEQENFELKVFVQSCKCKECTLTLKSVRSLYSHNELDSIVFNQN